MTAEVEKLKTTEKVTNTFSFMFLHLCGHLFYSCGFGKILSSVAVLGGASDAVESADAVVASADPNAVHGGAGGVAVLGGAAVGGASSFCRLEADDP